MLFEVSCSFFFWLFFSKAVACVLYLSSFLRFLDVKEKGRGSLRQDKHIPV